MNANTVRAALAEIAALDSEDRVEDLLRPAEIIRKELDLPPFTGLDNVVDVVASAQHRLRVIDRTEALFSVNDSQTVADITA